jgi:hypothetical protein
MAQLRKLRKLKKVADEIGYPYTSLRDAGLRGLFPLIRLNRAIYVDPDEVVKAIESRKDVAV